MFWTFCCRLFVILIYRIRGGREFSKTSQFLKGVLLLLATTVERSASIAKGLCKTRSAYRFTWRVAFFFQSTWFPANPSRVLQWRNNAWPCEDVSSDSLVLQEPPRLIDSPDEFATLFSLIPLLRLLAKRKTKFSCWLRERQSQRAVFGGIQDPREIWWIRPATVRRRLI
jgi:hypothetical protein